MGVAWEEALQYFKPTSEAQQEIRSREILTAFYWLSRLLNLRRLPEGFEQLIRVRKARLTFPAFTMPRRLSRHPPLPPDYSHLPPILPPDPEPNENALKTFALSRGSAGTPLSYPQMGCAGLPKRYSSGRSSPKEDIPRGAWQPFMACVGEAFGAPTVEPANFNTMHDDRVISHPVPCSHANTKFSWAVWDRDFEREGSTGWWDDYDDILCVVPRKEEMQGLWGTAWLGAKIVESVYMGACEAADKT
ncbi:hypothetical protein BU26DRAFT_348024 [Trematosphaeria pertusa]|uniref:Uncharacterized protein n=1 Tax=Trematosphaeria pertusa TaxID=390896 RepID=A0A6A6IA38_9PLEO|nr:uncharacterized protein BU26DRAFT_348024 [Trematosphaeria pertusa]KAF2247435.1 hypothetical protein BU26DRAFT_348024 [Trematosphaeria pertusa]